MIASWLATPAERVWRPSRAVRCGISGERIEPSDPTAISLWLGRAHRWVKAPALLREAARLMREVGRGSQIAPTLGWQVRLIKLPEHVIVLVGKRIVYAEDYSEGGSYNRYFSAREVAEEIAEALGTKAIVFDLTAYERFEAFMEEHGIDPDEWAYADFAAAVLGEEV